MNRAERRAAERPNNTAQTETNQPSEARLAANRENAQKSSGPVSAAGKAASKLNALKTGLTGVTVLLPSDDADAYQAHILSYEKLYKPVGPEECALVQSIADTRWRLNRIPALEIALLVLCRKELAVQDDYYNRTDLGPILEMEIRLLRAKEFRNLNLQEARLARRREKDTAELRALQAERKAQETEQLNQATTAYLAAQKQQQSFDLAELGFEFSKARFVAHLAAQNPPIFFKEAPVSVAETMQATA